MYTPNKCLSKVSTYTFKIRDKLDTLILKAVYVPCLKCLYLWAVNEKQAVKAPETLDRILNAYRS